MLPLLLQPAPDGASRGASVEVIERVVSLVAAIVVVWFPQRDRYRPPKPRARRPVTLPPFEVPDDVAGAVRVLERLTGAVARPLLDATRTPTSGRTCEAPQELVEALRLDARTAFAANGCFLFRRDQGFGSRPDLIALLPTADLYEALRSVGTDGINHDVTNDALAAGLRELEREQPFVLTGMGGDFVGGRFLAPVRHADRLAQRLHALCPDIVEQGTQTVAALAAQLRNTGTLYLWWD